MVASVLNWLSVVADCAWPLAAGFGVLMMFTAHCVRQSHADDADEAYWYMRAAALSLLLGLFLLWLRWRFL
jgi:hypothetical protein